MHHISDLDDNLSTWVTTDATILNAKQGAQQKFHNSQLLCGKEMSLNLSLKCQIGKERKAAEVMEMNCNKYVNLYSVFLEYFNHRINQKGDDPLVRTMYDCLYIENIVEFFEQHNVIKTGFIEIHFQKAYCNQGKMEVALFLKCLKDEIEKFLFFV